MTNDTIRNRLRANKNNFCAETTLNKLCDLSQKLLELAERESQALIQNDSVAFSVLQDDKEILSKSYLKASEEFRNNIGAFRRANTKIIERLEALQSQLGIRTNDNNKLIGQIHERAQSNTNRSLLLAKEYGGSKRARFAKPVTPNFPNDNSQPVKQEEQGGM